MFFSMPMSQVCTRLKPIMFMCKKMFHTNQVTIKVSLLEINVCLTQRPCQHTCTITYGSYTCQCNACYTKLGTRCDLRQCVVGGSCYVYGTKNPSNACQVRKVTSSQLQSKYQAINILCKFWKSCSFLPLQLRMLKLGTILDFGDGSRNSKVLRSVLELRILSA
jgi:hypothetical protein